ncbi:MAG: hypothetical protein U1F48_11210 [Burkholderiales bacterium]
MSERFARCAAWLFGIAVPIALAVVLLAPVPFMRGLGVTALACAALGVALNGLAWRSARRSAYWPVGASIVGAPAVAAATPVAVPAVAAAPATKPTPAPACTARYRAPRFEPRVSLARLVQVPRAFALVPGRLPARVTSHA